MTYDEMMEYCESMREADGFCRLNNGCSGPCYANTKAVLDEAKRMSEELGQHIRAYQGGSCEFYVTED